MSGYGYCVPPTAEEIIAMAPLFLRILSPVDFGENSLAALEYAAHLARQYEATVYLLHVAPTDEMHLHVRPCFYPPRCGDGHARYSAATASTSSAPSSHLCTPSRNGGTPKCEPL